MKHKVTANCTSLGLSNASRVMRMNRVGAAGVAFTAVGLILTAVNYATHIGGTMWLLTEDDDGEGRQAIYNAYREAQTKWTEEK